MTHICVSKVIIIVSGNGLSPGRRQAIIWNNAGISLIGPLGTNFPEIEIYAFSFKKMHLKMSSGKWRPFCLGLNVLITFLKFSINGLTISCLSVSSIKCQHHVGYCFGIIGLILTVYILRPDLIPAILVKHSSEIVQMQPPTTGISGLKFRATCLEIPRPDWTIGDLKF